MSENKINKIAHPEVNEYIWRTVNRGEWGVHKKGPNIGEPFPLVDFAGRATDYVSLYSKASLDAHTPGTKLPYALASVQIKKLAHWTCALSDASMMAGARILIEPVLTPTEAVAVPNVQAQRADAVQGQIDGINSTIGSMVETMAKIAAKVGA